MKDWVRVPVVALVFFAVFGGPAANGQQSDSSRELVDSIIREVIHHAIDAARGEVRRNTGVDPLKRGYIPGRTYDPAPGTTSAQTRRELDKLNREHDRRIFSLEEELERKLRAAEAEFQREAAKEDKADKIAEKRAKLQETVDAAYDKFEKNIAEENARFDEKRSEILAKH